MIEGPVMQKRGNKQRRCLLIATGSDDTAVTVFGMLFRGLG